MTRGLALIEKRGYSFFVNAHCVPCHHQIVTDLAAKASHAKGLLLDDKTAAERQKMVRAWYISSGSMLLELVDPPGSPAVPLYTMVALTAAGYPPDRMTSRAGFLMARTSGSPLWVLAGLLPPWPSLCRNYAPSG